MSAIVDGQVVNIGDFVGFKSDVEQGGEIVKIKRTPYGGKSLVLKATGDRGFHGEYIGGNEFTEELASDCWLD